MIAIDQALEEYGTPLLGKTPGNTKNNISAYLTKNNAFN